MCKKLIYLISFVLALGLAGDVQAADISWTGTIDNDWFTAGNWDLERLPTTSDNTYINLLPGPTIASGDAVGDDVYVGYDGMTGALTMDSGTLTITPVHTGVTCGWPADSVGTLNMNGGTITADFVSMGWGGTGTLNMTGGTIIAEEGTGGYGVLYVGGGGTGIGHYHLDGGTITTTYLQYGSGTIDITAGTLIIDGDVTAAIEGYIDDGWITAYGGAGVLLLDFDTTNPGKTTLWATGGNSAWNPSPSYDQQDVLPTVELSWSAPTLVSNPTYNIYL